MGGRKKKNLLEHGLDKNRNALKTITIIDAAPHLQLEIIIIILISKFSHGPFQYEFGCSHKWPICFFFYSETGL